MTKQDLIAWRKALGLSQIGAAKALGMTQQNYSLLELGRSGINMRTALACAAVSAGLSPWTPPQSAQQGSSGTG